MGNTIKRSKSQQHIKGLQRMENNILYGSDNEIDVPEMGIGQWIFQSFQNLPPDFVVLIEANTGLSITVEELLQQCISLVGSLIEMGVEQGDRIAIIGENTIKLCMSGFATWFLGAVMCPIDPTLKSREFQHLLNLLQPKVVFCDKVILEEVQDAIEKLSLDVVLIGVHTQDECGVVHMDSLLDRDDNRELFLPAVIEDIREETAVIVCSSGTTGMPKGVVISHFALNFQTKVLGGEWPPGKILHTSFFYWVTGILLYTGSSVNGITRVLVRTADAMSVLHAIDKYKPMMGLISPSLLSVILNQPNIQDFDLTSLLVLSVGGAPLTQPLIDGFKEYFTRTVLRQGYGCSEVSGAVSMTVSDNDLLSLGKPVAQTQIKIVDVNNGNILGVEEEGEILIKSPSVMKEYISNAKATEEALDDDGWYHTGDLGKFTEDEVLYITGRIKELLKVDCHQISPEEIESVIVQIPGVLDAAVAGILVGENNLPMALVVKVEAVDLNEEQITQIVSDTLSEFKQLRAGVRFVECIPRTSTGKIKRRDIQILADQLYSI